MNDAVLMVNNTVIVIAMAIIEWEACAGITSYNILTRA